MPRNIVSPFIDLGNSWTGATSDLFLDHILEDGGEILWGVLLGVSAYPFCYVFDDGLAFECGLFYCCFLVVGLRALSVNQPSVDSRLRLHRSITFLIGAICFLILALPSAFAWLTEGITVGGG